MKKDIKNLFQFLNSGLLIFSMVFIYSCNNDFLKVKNNQVVSQQGDTLLFDDSGTEIPLELELKGAGNNSWSIYQYPKGVEIAPMQGDFSNGKTVIKIKATAEMPGQPGMQELPLSLRIEGKGLVQYPLLCVRYGYPQFLWVGNYMDFEYGSEQKFSFKSGNGVLKWEITNIPSWLKVSRKKGLLLPDITETLTFSVDRNSLKDGLYKGVVTFVHNGPEKVFNLQVEMKVFELGLNGKIKPIPGIVLDADYCKTTGITVLAVRNPNRLILINPGQPFKEMPLNKEPTTVAISQNGEQAICGFSKNDLSIIDLASLTIAKNYRLDFAPTDVALGDNGWAYLISDSFYEHYLRSVNLNSGEIFINPTDVHEITKLVKVPGKSLVYGTKGGEWSRNLLVADISAGAAAPLIDNWPTSPWNFWLSEDGNRVFAGHKEIYQAPAYQKKEWINYDLPVVGQMENLAFAIKSLVHSSVRKEILAVYGPVSFATAARIFRFDDGNYTQKGFFDVNESQIISPQGDLVTLRTELPWMFVDKTGQNLTLIKKGLSQSTSDIYWFYETISLPPN